MPRKWRIGCVGLCFSCCILLWGSIVPVRAHIEKGSMPDSVAEIEYQILLEFEPDNHQVRNQLGAVYLRMKKYSEAEQEFQIILDADPKNFHATDGLGVVAMAQGKYDLAMRLLQEAIDLNPDDIMVYYHLGQVYECLDNKDEARKAYQLAMDKYEALPEEKKNPQDINLLQQALKNLTDPENGKELL